MAVSNQQKTIGNQKAIKFEFVGFDIPLNAGFCRLFIEDI
jgi:hypothetical protein